MELRKRKGAWKMRLTSLLSSNRPLLTGKWQRSMSELLPPRPFPNRFYQQTTNPNHKEWKHTIHTPFPKLTPNCAIVRSFTLLLATMTSAISAANVTLDTMAVTRAIISAQMEIPWWPRNRACNNVRRERPAATGWRTRRISNAFKRALTREVEMPSSYPSTVKEGYFGQIWTHTFRNSTGME
jgi:hypothetical protein